MINQQVLQSHPFFYGIFAVIAMLALLLVFSFLGTIAFSLVMVIILKPAYDFFLRRVKKAGIATLLTTTMTGMKPVTCGGVNLLGRMKTPQPFQLAYQGYNGTISKSTEDLAT